MRNPATSRPLRAARLKRELLGSRIDFVPPDVAQTVVAAARDRRIRFNFGDCFADALAKTTGEPLLTLDVDFRNADVAVLLPPAE